MELNDPTTLYAEYVRSGEILAGPWVRLACDRHFKMLEMAEDPDCEFYWDPPSAQRLIEFFPDVLKVEVGNETVPFDLLDWQVFCAGSINGWRRRKDGLRLITEVYIEGGKGCGKSPFAGGIGIYMQMFDGEKKAEVYSGASKYSQADILFQDAVSMKQSSPFLNRRLVERGLNPVKSLHHRASGSVFKPVSGDNKKSGIRPSCGLIDELHEHRDRYTIDMLTQTKGRQQPLLFIITNSGFDRTSVCYEWHRQGRDVLRGTKTAWHQFFYIMALDPGDDPLSDTSCWPKTNPGLGITVTPESLEKQVLAARQIPARTNEVLRLNFCQWTDADQVWMTRDLWEANEEELVEFAKPKSGEFTGGGYALWAPDTGFDQAECYLGLDLAWTTDMVALAFAFPEGDRVLSWIEYFIPLGHHLSDLREKENRDDLPYLDWIQRGLIRGVTGPTVRTEAIAARVGEVLRQYDVKHAAFDRYAHKTLRQQMIEEGVSAPWIEHPQGFRRGGILKNEAGYAYKTNEGTDFENPLWMPGSMRNMEDRLLNRTLGIQPSPVTRTQVASVAVREDPAGTGNRIFDKAKAVSRIDGIVAQAMAIATADAILPNMDLSGFLSNPVIVK